MVECCAVCRAQIHGLADASQLNFIEWDVRNTHHLLMTRDDDAQNRKLLINRVFCGDKDIVWILSHLPVPFAVVKVLTSRFLRVPHLAWVYSSHIHAFNALGRTESEILIQF